MRSKHRWFVLLVLYLFILLHQADKLLIGPLTIPVIDDFGITQAHMGAVSTLAILVAAALCVELFIRPLCPARAKLYDTVPSGAAQMLLHACDQPILLPCASLFSGCANPHQPHI